MCISEVVHVAFLILSNPEINADVHLLKLNIQFFRPYKSSTEYSTEHLQRKYKTQCKFYTF